MMALYIWQGPEEGLGYVAIRQIAIDTYSADHEFSRASGSILAYDYVRQREERWTWKAERRFPTWEHRWKLRWDQVVTNEGLRKDRNRFLRRMLSEFATLGRISGELKRFEGECPQYQGPCVCDYLRQHNEFTGQPAFPWYDMTGGKAPHRCFICSCGRRWWQFDDNADEWVQIGDSEAWDLLVQHDGEPPRLMDADENRVYHLVSTMLRDGKKPWEPGPNTIFGEPMDDGEE